MATETKLFDNNLSDGLKGRIRDAAAKRIEALLTKDKLSCNDIAALAGVFLGAVKARPKQIADVAGIVDAIFSGARSASGKKPSTESIKTFLASMNPEERDRFLAELNR